MNYELRMATKVIRLSFYGQWSLLAANKAQWVCKRFRKAECE